MIKNRLYVNQFYLLAFISVVTFKVGMLPSLMAQINSTEGILAVIIMMIVELIMIFIILSTMSHGSILDIKIPKIFKVVISMCIIFSLFVKFSVFFGESVIYIQNHLFENANYVYVALPLMLSLLYMAYKGINNIARVAEIIFFVLAFCVLFNILFANIDIQLNVLKKLSFTTTTIDIIDKYIIWFGDFTPFLFASIVKPKSRKIYSILTVFGIILIPIILEIAFVCIFQQAGVYIEYAFSKLAVYNQFSFLLGSFDIPSIISFLIAIIIKLALMLFALVDIFAYLFEKKKLTTILIGIFLFSVALILKEKESLVAFATSSIRYIVLIIEYSMPIIVYFLMKIYKQDKIELNSYLKKVQNA